MQGKVPTTWPSQGHVTVTMKVNAPFTITFVFYSCCSKLPQARWPQTAKVPSLPVLEAVGPKSASVGQNQGHRSPLEMLGRVYSSLLPASLSNLSLPLLQGDLFGFRKHRDNPAYSHHLEIPHHMHSLFSQVR